MGILDSFERGLDRAVNGAFARTFRSGLAPVEITSALRKELDTHASPVARDRVLVPNRFTVRVSTEDHAAMTALGGGLIDELAEQVSQYAAQQRYQMVSPPVITLEEDRSLTIGLLEVRSSSERTEVTWLPVLEIDGRRHRLGDRTVIGRGSEADITVDDSGISRRHLEIVWDGRRAEARDLGSTNGSTLNGARLTRAGLPNESVLQAGRTRMVFRVVAHAGGAAS
ncbi:FhaA domain-containing protein [uncultured Amnibacterium sp.]|uniref:FhaA domain-containing protein n=1 Tax=uncultured Amnibacterium sp. TaxID=1631851 RepID=UPI0035CB934D